ncbi:MAG: hypothetical protein JNJ60_00825 [Rhodocyclaceae bacterium]|nr:hypothetical protein [Rhodocyclaceae bacterium]
MLKTRNRAVPRNTGAAGRQRAAAVLAAIAAATLYGGAACASDAVADTAAPQARKSAPRFHVSRIVISGHDLLFADHIERALPAYLGRRLDTRDIDHLLAQLRGIFVARGYQGTRASVRAACPSAGTLEIDIQPARVEPAGSVAGARAA